LKQLFHITESKAENLQPVLSIRLGETHASFAITNKQGNELYELAYCTEENWNEKTLMDFFEEYPSLNNSFYQVFVAYDFSQSILAPVVFYKPEESQALLNSMFGMLPGSHVISERIAEWQLYNTYAVAAEVQGWINKKFPAAQFWHQYSLAVKNIPVAGDAGNLLIDIRTDNFAIVGTKNSRLLIAQSFSYSTPEDVLYYLLKICHEFSLSQKEVKVHLSGLIDKDSALYKEFYQYFINVEFREAGWKTESDYPNHFFTSLNDLAKCAS
jgi:Protein of unknown function (DUF3822)